MYFLTAVSFAASLLALTSAAPAAISERSADKCPGMSYISPEAECSSGFVGCVPYDRSSEVCNGNRRFFNDCWVAPGLGFWQVCKDTANAVTFIGCTTNGKICDRTNTGSSGSKSETRSAVPPPSGTPTSAVTASWTCPAGNSYYKPDACSSGFVGCTSNNAVCNGERKYWGTCPPNHGNYYNCGNGFVGCSTNTRICG